jgi:hypothetical protein
VLFQSSTTNGATDIGVLPNGTGTFGTLRAFGGSDPSNAQWVTLFCNGGSEARITSAYTGTPASGTYLPMTFYTGGSERMRIDTSGNLGLGVTPSAWGSTFKAFDFGTGSALGGYVGNAGTYFSSNGYFNGTNWIYKTTSGASYTLQYNGAHSWYTAPSGTAGNAISFTQAMTLNASGNLGIGTSSPTGSVSRLLTVQNTGTSSVGITTGDYSSGVTSMVSLIEAFGGRNDGNSTFGGRHGASYRRCDGTAIASGISIGYYAFGGQWGTDTSYQSSKLLYSASIAGVAEGSFTSASAMPTAITFRTGSTGEALSSVNTSYGTERMRIDSSGNLLLNTTSPAPNSYSTINSPGQAGNLALMVQHTATTSAVRGIGVKCPNFNGDDGYLFIGARSGGDVFYVRTNGNVTNVNNSYGAISDVSLKENIEDATPKLEDLLKVKIRNYNLIDDPRKTKQLGVVAQEVETVFPGIVEINTPPEGGVEVKSVKYSVFVPMLIKAIQELKAELDELKAKVK